MICVLRQRKKTEKVVIRAKIEGRIFEFGGEKHANTTQ